jgi:hypothetical protein
MKGLLHLELQQYGQCFGLIKQAARLEPSLQMHQELLAIGRRVAQQTGETFSEEESKFIGGR